MKTIKLSNSDDVAFISDEFSYLSKYRYRKNSGGYAVRSASVAEILRGSSKDIYMHREVLPPPGGFEIDHIDRNPLNNCVDNLRVCTHQQNMQNRKVSSPKKSEYKGVCWHKGNKMWQANIGVGGKQLSLGYAKNEADAARMYDAAAKEHYGAYAVLNFPQ